MNRTEGFGAAGQQCGQQPGKRISPTCMANYAGREAHYLCRSSAECGPAASVRYARTRGSHAGKGCEGRSGMAGYGKRGFTQEEKARRCCARTSEQPVSSTPRQGRPERRGRREAGSKTATEGTETVRRPAGRTLGRSRTQVKVLGGMGVQGEGRPFSKRGPFPLPKKAGFPSAVPAGA